MEGVESSQLTEFFLSDYDHFLELGANMMQQARLNS